MSSVPPRTLHVQWGRRGRTLSSDADKEKKEKERGKTAPPPRDKRAKMPSQKTQNMDMKASQKTENMDIVSDNMDCEDARTHVKKVSQKSQKMLLRDVALSVCLSLCLSLSMDDCRSLCLSV